MKQIIILGATGQIGGYLVDKLSDNYKIIDANRKNNFIDFSDKNSIIEFVRNHISEQTYGIINCYGIQGPIGNFIDCDFEDWENNIFINLTNYAFFLHQTLNKKNNLKKIINFSGGGAVGPREGFSAYSISKIALFKLTETLSVELKNRLIDVNIVAPGAIKSNMTQEILKSKNISNKEKKYAHEILENGGQDKNKILQICQQLLSKKSNGISGRLISAQWDKFDDSKLDFIRDNKDLFTLRRIDNKYFYKKEK